MSRTSPRGAFRTRVLHSEETTDLAQLTDHPEREKDSVQGMGFYALGSLEGLYVFANVTIVVGGSARVVNGLMLFRNSSDAERFAKAGVALVSFLGDCAPLLLTVEQAKAVARRKGKQGLAFQNALFQTCAWMWL